MLCIVLVLVLVLTAAGFPSFYPTQHFPLKTFPLAIFATLHFTLHKILAFHNFKRSFTGTRIACNNNPQVVAALPQRSLAFKIDFRVNISSK